MTAEEGEDDRNPPLVALTDAGLDLNLPLLPLLRPEREVDVHVVLDFSQYDPGFTHSSEWAQVVDYCNASGAPFPATFDHAAVARSPLSVFPGNAEGSPTVVCLHLGVSQAEAAKGMFSPLANAAAGGYCDLGTLRYTAAQTNELAAFMQARVGQVMPGIRDALRHARDAKMVPQGTTKRSTAL
jgi:hypothetical protein